MLSARAAVSPATLWKRREVVEGGSCDGCRSCRDGARRRAAAVRVRAAAPRRVEAVAMGSPAETTEEEEEAVVVSTEAEKEEMAAAGGGVKDPYGEDRATEELPVTPWAFSVARYSR